MEATKQSEIITSTSARFLVLILCSFLCFGSYFVYDNPMALQEALMSVRFLQKLNINLLEFNMLYSIYSFPNIFLPLLAGYTVDTLGARLCIVIFSCLVCIGQGIFVLGVEASNYWIALLGRGVYGIGSESMICKLYSVAQSGVIARWFRNKELSTAIAINISISDMGCVLNAWLQPHMNAWGSMSLGLWIGFIVCIFSVICGFGVNYYDAKRENIVLSMNSKSEERVNISTIQEFSMNYWLILLTCCVHSICVLPFFNIATGFMNDRFGFSATSAGDIIGILYLMSPVLSPILGATVDKYGKRTYLSNFYIVLLSTFSCLIAHMQYFLMSDCDKCLESIMPMIYLQIGYSIYCAVVWSAIPYTVPEYAVVTAFGLTSSCLNLSLAVSPILVGFIDSETGEYKFISLFFMIVGVMGVVSGTWLHLRNIQSNSNLNTAQSKHDEISKENTCDEEHDTYEESELLKRG